MDDETPEEDDASFLSFIDVISCGLGAATLLFLIYAVLPHHGSVASLGAAGNGGTSPISLAGLGDQGAPKVIVKVAKRAVGIFWVELGKNANAAEQATWAPKPPKGCTAFTEHAKDHVTHTLVCQDGVDPTQNESLVYSGSAVATFTVHAEAYIGWWKASPPLDKLTASLGAGDTIARFDFTSENHPIK